MRPGFMNERGFTLTELIGKLFIFLDFIFRRRLRGCLRMRYFFQDQGRRKL